MTEAIVLLGGNLGDQPEIQERAAELISMQVGKIVARSSLYLSEPWGFISSNPFINQVLIVNTKLLPQELLDLLLIIEKKLGRKKEKNKPSTEYLDRQIDLDILFYGDNIINTYSLTVPHPLIQERNFVLGPLVEICPEMIHPVLGKTIEQLQRECKDNGVMTVYNLPKSVFKENVSGVLPRSLEIQ